MRNNDFNSPIQCGCCILFCHHGPPRCLAMGSPKRGTGHCLVIIVGVRLVREYFPHFCTISLNFGCQADESSTKALQGRNHCVVAKIYSSLPQVISMSLMRLRWSTQKHRRPLPQWMPHVGHCGFPLSRHRVESRLCTVLPNCHFVFSQGPGPHYLNNACHLCRSD